MVGCPGQVTSHEVMSPFAYKESSMGKLVCVFAGGRNEEVEIELVCSFLGQHGKQANDVFLGREVVEETGEGEKTQGNRACNSAKSRHQSRM
jgi:hypothetical protein